MNKQLRLSFPRTAALGGLALAAVPSFAAIDVTSATTAISDGSTAMLAVLAAIIGVVAVVWAMRKVIGLFGR